MAGNIIRASQGVKQVVSVKSPLGGMTPDLPPSSQAPSAFLYQQNIRRVGGAVVSRGGQAAFATLSGEATGMVDFQCGEGGLRMFFVPGGLALFEFNPNRSPLCQKIVDLAFFSPQSSMFDIGRVEIESNDDTPGFSGLVTGGAGGASGVAGSTLYSMKSVRPGYGLSQDYVTGGGFQLGPVLRIPSVGGNLYHEVSQYIQSGNYLFLGTASTTDIAIFRFDGLSLVREYTGAPIASMPVWRCSAKFRDTAVMVDAGGNIHIRTDAGTWTVVAGTDYPVSLNSFRDALYYTDGAEDLLAFDGAAITAIPRATNGVDAGSTIFDCAVLGPNLYYVWYDAGLTKFRVGKYDGTTWNANFKNLLTDFPTMTGISGFCPIAGFNGSLYVGVDDPASAPAGNPVFLKSPGTDVAGTWTKIDLGLGAAYLNSPPDFIRVV